MVYRMSCCNNRLTAELPTEPLIYLPTTEGRRDTARERDTFLQYGTG
jgi:hypothetical protein